jgi:hypothetical protein
MNTAGSQGARLWLPNSRTFSTTLTLGGNWVFTQWCQIVMANHDPTNPCSGDWRFIQHCVLCFGLLQVASAPVIVKPTETFLHSNP